MTTEHEKRKRQDEIMAKIDAVIFVASAFESGKSGFSAEETIKKILEILRCKEHS